MAFVTYILLAALQAGLESRFHPEVFGVVATKAIVVLNNHVAGREVPISALPFSLKWNDLLNDRQIEMNDHSQSFNVPARSGVVYLTEVRSKGVMKKTKK